MNGKNNVFFVRYDGADLCKDSLFNYHETCKNNSFLFLGCGIYILQVHCVNFITETVFKNIIKKAEAGRGAAARGVTAKPTGCGFDPHSRR